jgi:hypothetical protein
MDAHRRRATAVSRLPLPPQPDEVKLKMMNQETTNYLTIIAAKREPALLVPDKKSDGTSLPQGDGAR